MNIVPNNLFVTKIIVVRNINLIKSDPTITIKIKKQQQAKDIEDQVVPKEGIEIVKGRETIIKEKDSNPEALVEVPDLEAIAIKEEVDIREDKVPNLDRQVIANKIQIQFLNPGAVFIIEEHEKVKEDEAKTEDDIHN